jgi:multidrug efflux pump subunit AcrB
MSTLANYAYINLNDPVARSYGVGETQIFGAGQYAMRLWVKPDQLSKLNITVTDIVNAIKAQNTVNHRAHNLHTVRRFRAASISRWSDGHSS